MLVLIVSFSLQNIMWVVVMGQIIYFSVTRRLPFFNKPSLWGLSHLFSSSSSLFTARYLVPGIYLATACTGTCRELGWGVITTCLQVAAKLNSKLEGGEPHPQPPKVQVFGLMTDSRLLKLNVLV